MFNVIILLFASLILGFAWYNAIMTLCRKAIPIAVRPDPELSEILFHIREVRHENQYLQKNAFPEMGGKLTVLEILLLNKLVEQSDNAVKVVRGLVKRLERHRGWHGY